MKRCSTCKIKKDLSEFWKNRSRSDGLHHHCKLCHTTYQKRNKHKWNFDYEKMKETKRRGHKRRLKNNINYKLSRLLSDRMRKALKKNYKSGIAKEYLGCSVEEFKQHLESKFQNGMTWENHGQFGWHIDHIKPLFSFDLTNIAEVKRACHYTNMQPLWWRDNFLKGKKI